MTELFPIRCAECAPRAPRLAVSASRKSLAEQAECHYGSDRWADGWKAYRDGETVAVFCPDCAEHEFRS